MKIIFRGDGGFCRWRRLRWCEDHGVNYIVGLAQNARMRAQAQPRITQAQSDFAAQTEKQRQFGEVAYAAASWDRPRRVLVKAEHTDKGSNPRFVATNLAGAAPKLYAEIYCARGERENRIKEQQLGLFADRTSCQDGWANQFRLLLSSGADVLLERRRARAPAGTIRLKLLKMGAVVGRNTRRVRLLLARAIRIKNSSARSARRWAAAEPREVLSPARRKITGAGGGVPPHAEKIRSCRPFKSQTTKSTDPSALKLALVK